ncbi:purine-nucleoside phosphorylase [Sinorhizobium meliloti WSM1022]|jgi:purine-nucleoside phosphorylase|uniref:purine-nucleoside phosphorylase n=1 Tax=Rhizobium meliloti TaxID=382 RepID=UPI0004201C1D|nr:purine-nucleoside phosphorylase [Sinorhizobium meliloti]ASQ05487.1 purine-nucleoside phosphorylase [Sinorhizobium meliloti]MCO6422898.1 purine-nucleoside phosphorylase [Sinorhizobium meliloti]MDW9411053.1 purine-nucleoside phosphorylase [Sinorhizobium meliloti]MDW9443321.1 purine-nucleoside phosphorylase [Sinorhizobium meliloti]MDW9456198.1 purine-nucleoside phosphorylase [Sinorhizobium meliloti]
MTAAADFLKGRLGALAPRYGIVLGSGLGSLVDAVAEPLRIPYADIPGFPVSSVSGHAGEFVAGRIGDTPVAVLSGRAHYYERGDANAMRVPIETLKRIGVENLILTNSAGSLREDMPPGSVMRIADHIAFASANPLIGVESDERFVGMTNAYDAALAIGMEEAAERLGIPLARGVYMWFSGPSFETPAEIRMARILGADAVGMSTVPEVILARFFGLKVAAASVVTNFAAGMTGSELSHEETKQMAPLGGTRLAAILKEMISSEG